jgi:hypothetical protein
MSFSAFMQPVAGHLSPMILFLPIGGKRYAISEASQESYV